MKSRRLLTIAAIALLAVAVNIIWIIVMWRPDADASPDPDHQSRRRIVQTSRDYPDLGDGYSVILETSAVNSASRVLFFSHAFLELRGVVDATGEPYVVPAWSKNHFLIACDAPTDDPIDPKAKIVEFDADGKNIVSEYVHPRGLQRLTIPGSWQGQRSAIARGGDSLIWLLTQVVEGHTVRRKLEALDWESKTIQYELDIPAGRNPAITPIAFESNCVLTLKGAEAATEVRVVSSDGRSTEVPMVQEGDGNISFLDANDGLVCGIIDNQRLVVAEYLPEDNAASVRFSEEIQRKEGWRVVSTALLPEDGLVMVGLASPPFGTLRIEEVIFLSAADGGTVSSGRLEEAALAISFVHGHIWSLCRDNRSLMVYDQNLKPVHEDLPLTSIVNVVP